MFLQPLSALAALAACQEGRDVLLTANSGRHLVWLQERRIAVLVFLCVDLQLEDGGPWTHGIIALVPPPRLLLFFCIQLCIKVDYLKGRRDLLVTCDKVHLSSCLHSVESHRQLTAPRVGGEMGVNASRLTARSVVNPIGRRPFLSCHHAGAQPIICVLSLSLSVCVRGPVGQPDGDHEGGDRRPAARGGLL